MRILTEYRHELAQSHKGFFKVMDKIYDPKEQERAVWSGVFNLFEACKHDYVIPLINALEKRRFKSGNLQVVAIREAFHNGAWRNIKYFVEKFYEHLAITSENYANGLVVSWQHDKFKEVFPFLLDQADQGDLEEVKKDDYYRKMRISAKPLMMPFQRLNLQEKDSKEKEPNLSWKHFVGSTTFNH